MDVLSRIRKLQQDREWSNYRLAREAGISESSLNNMFRLNNTPTIPTLEALCRGFGITLSQFFMQPGEATTLAAEQIEMLNLWNTLSKEQKCALLALFRAM
jgi:transcriptional regulator with XRE-family HTH domain